MIRITIEIDESIKGGVEIKQVKSDDKIIVHSHVTKKQKECIRCHERYVPTGNRQQYCPECKGKPKDKIEPIDETLKDIEEKRKETYQL